MELNSKNEQHKWDSHLHYGGALYITRFLHGIGNNANSNWRVEMPCLDFCYLNIGKSAPQIWELDHTIVNRLRSF